MPNALMLSILRMNYPERSADVIIDGFLNDRVETTIETIKLRIIVLRIYGKGRSIKNIFKEQSG